MSASEFEQTLANTVRLARSAAERAVSENPDIPPKDITFDNTEWTDTEILLQVTGLKHLDDDEEQTIILGVFEDTFFETLEEWDW